MRKLTMLTKRDGCQPVKELRREAHKLGSLVAVDGDFCESTEAALWPRDASCLQRMEKRRIARAEAYPRGESEYWISVDRTTCVASVSIVIPSKIS
jgi:hypothetical protein